MVKEVLEEAVCLACLDAKPRSKGMRFELTRINAT